MKGILIPNKRRTAHLDYITLSVEKGINNVIQGSNPLPPKEGLGIIQSKNAEK